MHRMNHYTANADSRATRLLDASTVAMIPVIGTIIAAILAVVAVLIVLIATIVASNLEREAADREREAGRRDRDTQVDPAKRSRRTGFDDD
jgi:hypothetical protein